MAVMKQFLNYVPVLKEIGFDCLELAVIINNQYQRVRKLTQTVGI